MSGEYIPDHAAIREAYIYDRYQKSGGDAMSAVASAAEFDRWLAEHDAEVAAKARRDRDAESEVWPRDPDERLQFADWRYSVMNNTTALGFREWERARAAGIRGTK